MKARPAGHALSAPRRFRKSKVVMRIAVIASLLVSWVSIAQAQDPQSVRLLQGLLQKYQKCILEQYENQVGEDGDKTNPRALGPLRDSAICVAGNSCTKASRQNMYNSLKAQADRGDPTNFEANLKTAILNDCFQCAKHGEYHTKQMHCALECKGDQSWGENPLKFDAGVGPCFEGCKAGVDISKLVNDIVNDIRGVLQGINPCQQANAILPAPAGLTATDQHSRTQTGQVTLTWQPVPGASGYKVFRSWSPVYYDHTHARDSGRDHNLMASILDTGAWPLALPGSANSATISDLPLFFAVQFQVAAVEDISAVTAGGSQTCQGLAASTSITPTAAPDAPVWGFADTHTHQFANMAAGGYFLGKPYGPPDDAFAGDYVGHGLFLGQMPHHTGGYPQFDGWPTWDTMVHQQMYEDWLYRSFLGGMKLMVMHGLNTESLCISLTNAESSEIALEAQAAASAPAGAAAGAGAGAGAGSAIGSALGTFLLPGLGTVLGGIAGGAAGGTAGAAAGAGVTLSFVISADAISGAVKARIQQNQGAVAACNDMAVAKRQIQGAKDMEAYLNSQCAMGADPPRCPQKGMGWYHIVESAGEARATINRGQMAVVLGIEVDRMFDCINAPPYGDSRSGGHICTPQEVQQSLNSLVSLGVRHIFPAHLADTAFAGMAIYPAPVTWNINNYFMNGRWIDATAQNGKWTFNTACPAEVFSVPEVYPTPPYILFDFNKSEVPLPLASLLADVEGLGLSPQPPNYPYVPITPATPPTPTSPPTTTPRLGHCNSLGLTSLGKGLIGAMMDRHLIIDIDHMSLNSVNDTLNLTWGARKDSPYPVVMGHNGPSNMARTAQNRSERSASDNEFLYLQMYGGVFGLGLGGGTNSTDVYEYTAQHAGWSRPHLKIPNDCSSSSKIWAQEYMYAVDHLGGPVDINGRPTSFVAFASDQFLVPFMGPRFGYDDPQFDVFKEVVRGCGNQTVPGGGTLLQKSLQPPQTRVNYPISVQNPGIPIRLEKSHLGNRSWDFNYDGMAHIGMYPDLLQDALKIGFAPSDLRPIFNSAEGYIKMWERAEKPYVSQTQPASTGTPIRSIVRTIPTEKPLAIAQAPGVVTSPAIPHLPALAASVCQTLNGTTCLTPTATRPPATNMMAIVTVTSGGTAVGKATVKVVSQIVSVLSTANGTAVLSYRACETAGPNPTHIPCEATITKTGYQEVAIKLP
jgi:hypothetical protein